MLVTQEPVTIQECLKIHKQEYYYSANFKGHTQYSLNYEGSHGAIFCHYYILQFWMIITMHHVHKAVVVNGYHRTITKPGLRYHNYHYRNVVISSPSIRKMLVDFLRSLSKKLFLILSAISFPLSNPTVTRVVSLITEVIIFRATELGLS